MPNHSTASCYGSRVLAGLVLAGLLAAAGSCKLDRPGVAQDEGEEAAINVRVERPVLRAMEEVIEVHGNLEPVEKVDVVAEVSGPILEVAAKEGDSVQAGQLLARIDDEEYRLSLSQSEAAFRVAQSDYESGRQLYDQGMKSRSELEKLKRSYQDAQSNLQMSRLRVKNAELRSPIRGVVLMRNAELFRQAGAMETLFTVGDLSSFKVPITVTEAEVARLRLGQEVRMRVDAVVDDPASFPFLGTVSRIQPQVDPQTGTVKVEVGLADPGARGVKPGMFTRLKIVTAIHDHALVIPRRALAAGEKNYVWLVEGSGARMVTVTTGLTDEGGVEILDGITPGDEVIVEGHAALTPRSKISIVSPGRDSGNPSPGAKSP